MTRSISRTLLTMLALVLLIAGSFNLNPTRAHAVSPAETSCAELCPVEGGPLLCGEIIRPDGTIIKCGMRDCTKGC